MFLFDSTSGIVVVTILVTYLRRHDDASPNSAADAQLPSHIVVSDGECNVVGDCVHCPEYPSNYGSNLACDIRFRSDGMLLGDDFATENSLDDLLLDCDPYSELTGPVGIAVTSDSLFWSSDYSTNHKGWLLCAEVVSDVGDPHVGTVDVWRIGWSTFVLVPLASVELSKFLVRGDVRPYASMEVVWEATTWSYTAVYWRVRILST